MTIKEDLAIMDFWNEVWSWIDELPKEVTLILWEMEEWWELRERLRSLVVKGSPHPAFSSGSATEQDFKEAKQIRDEIYILLTSIAVSR